MKFSSFVVALLVLALFAVTTSCKPNASQAEVVTVSAAASLKEAFEEIATDFEAARPGVKVVLNFAGSQSLRMQIEQGAEVDAFASANYEHLAALVKTGHVLSENNFAENALVVVTPVADEKLQRFEDLVHVERLVLGGSEVPIGRYSDEVIAKADKVLGDEFSTKVSAHIASRENNVRLTLAKVVLGEADAALVYRTDAISSGKQVRIVEIPQEFNVVASYFIGATAAAPSGKYGKEFIEAVTSKSGVAVLSKYGFQSPAGLLNKSGFP